MFSFNISATDTRKLQFLADNLGQYLSATLTGLTQDYYSKVLEQFRNAPPWWPPLADVTVESKRAKRAAGRPTAFTTPEQILVDEGLLRDSIHMRYTHIQHTPQGDLPVRYQVGLFRGMVAGKGRLRWGWQHEFGSKMLIRMGWKRSLAKAHFKRMRYKQTISLRKPMENLKIGKADIEGKMNIDKFINTVRRLAIRIYNRILIKKTFKKAEIFIPKRSFLRELLTIFRLDWVVGWRRAMRHLMVILNAM